MSRVINAVVGIASLEASREYHAYQVSDMHASDEALEIMLQKRHELHEEVEYARREFSRYQGKEYLESSQEDVAENRRGMDMTRKIFTKNKDEYDKLMQDPRLKKYYEANVNGFERFVLIALLFGFNHFRLGRNKKSELRNMEIAYSQGRKDGIERVHEVREERDALMREREAK